VIGDDVAIEPNTAVSRPELLAPAGNPQALRAAVENGADAVYLGGKSFGARASAENFDRQELGEALAYAHLRGVKVYVTANTLVDNGEFGELSEFLLFLYREGADALLVQDLGAVAWARRVLPELPLHGSTQMTVHNAAGVQFLAGLGLRRVVLARETSYQELLEIRRQSALELEVFVHGALCISYSGQCLFSSMVGGRSGNRGSCAQPCRMAYTLVDDRGGQVPHPLERVLGGSGGACTGQHLLSTRDLMLLEKLPQLVQAGVAALKIEGRMKRPEYVATVVRIYRNALDRAWRDPERYQVSEEEVRDLAQVFNRGFTTGYFDGRPGRLLMSYTRPNNRGLYLGRVLKTTPGKGVVFKTRLPLRVGDGIEFWMQKGDREGITVHSMLLHLPAAEPAGCPPGDPVSAAAPGSEVEIAVPFVVKPGDRVFKTHDERLISEARLSFTGTGRLKIPVRIVVRACRGDPLELEAVDADGIRVTVKGTLPGEIALKHPLTPEVAQAQIERLGNTPFTLAGLDCDLDGTAMYPLSELNTVRRDLTAALESARLDRFRRTLPEGVEETMAALWSSLRQDAAQAACRTSARPLLAVAVADYTGMEAAIDGGASAVYFGGLSYRGREAWNRGAVDRAVDMCRTNNVRAYLILPRIWKEGERPGAAEWLDIAVKLRVAGVVAGDLGGLKLAIQSGLETVTDLSVPVFNDLAIQLLLRQGAARLTLSPELNREQLRNLRFRGAPCLEMVVHGTLPLMVSEYCPVGAVTGTGDRCPETCRRTPCFLEDRQGYRFPLQLDEHCRMTLYNSRELCLIEHLGDIIQDGYGSLRLDLRSHEAKAVREITRIYGHALKDLLAGAWNASAARQAWERLDRLSLRGLTRGHYLRGVIEK
jgi:putative protease